MFKLYLLPLVLLGGLAIAADESLDEPLVMLKGDITKAQFMELSLIHISEPTRPY